MLMRLLSIALAISLVTSCAPTYEQTGVGQKLYTRQTLVSTNDLAAYFRELCTQANLVQSGVPVTCSNYSVLVQTGFNDIDSRCDDYIAWIDNKRIEVNRTKSSILAVGNTSTTVLTLAKVGTTTIAYVAEALGLTNALYDASNNSLLTGLESSTIKKIVYERRQEFRKQFSKVQFSTTPEMVYALRSYLRICTPQTIVLDANTYAISAASGVQAPSLEASVRKDIEAIAPLTAKTKADVVTKRGQVRCPECEKLFPANAGYTPAQIKAAQTALCVKPDGDVGEITLAAVKNYRDTQGRERTGVVTEPEYIDMTRFGCKPEDPKSGIKNFYEAVTYRGKFTSVERLVDNLNLIIAEPQLDPAKTTLATAELREKIATARDKFGFGAANAIDKTFMSRALKDKIASEAEKLRPGG